MLRFYTDNGRQGLIVLLYLVGASFGGAALAETSSQATFMKLGKPAYAPVGYLDFCGRRPDQCMPSGAAAPRVVAGSPSGDGGLIVTASLRQDPAGEAAAARQPPARTVVARRGAVSGQAALPYSTALMVMLDETNRRINAAILPESDMQTHGVPDHWDLPLDPGGRGAGDCEDYALQKREDLVRQGLPPSALSMAVARTRWGEIHAVLVVDTDASNFVLDNLSSEVRPWRSLDYRWIVRQAPGGGPTDWVSLEANNTGA